MRSGQGFYVYLTVPDRQKLINVNQGNVTLAIDDEAEVVEILQ